MKKALEVARKSDSGLVVDCRFSADNYMVS